MIRVRKGRAGPGLKEATSHKNIKLYTFTLHSIFKFVFYISFPALTNYYFLIYFYFIFLYLISLSFLFYYIVINFYRKIKINFKYILISNFHLKFRFLTLDS